MKRSFWAVLLIIFICLDQFGGDGNCFMEAYAMQTDNHPPNPPSKPIPNIAATDQPNTLTLSWQCNDPDSGDILRYDIYLDTNYPPSTVVASDRLLSFLVRTNLTVNTTYYWQVVAKDNHLTSATSATFLKLRNKFYPSIYN